MASKIGIPIAVACAVVAVGAVLGGIIVFADDGNESGGGRAAGPAPTTRLSLAAPDPSGTEPVSDNPYPRVPSEQVDGNLSGEARTAGRHVYIPVQDNDCWREQVWPLAEHADRVAVEIRTLPFPPPSGATLDADGGFGCMAYGSLDGPHAVVELAEPLGDRRLVVTYDYGTQPS
ncbi:hypothetical protein [Actinophytocola algeriensis]|uniref:Uncharacterized protein n=1 Tax=Actinophytocola algeriensis TaxID=1768010 RepID=A0A7W7VBP1_9PSEU|nr:hypothetical protein [Actinophytocola algeriensis]MBB4904186.1 hypothetical protein [Actinophytocola algeriensis]MBE1476957.1 hypothetical protein [Actinophytocola algeriensis]